MHVHALHLYLVAHAGLGFALQTIKGACDCQRLKDSKPLCSISSVCAACMHANGLHSSDARLSQCRHAHRACWDEFTDSTGAMAFYTVQAFLTGRKGADSLISISRLINVQLATSYEFSGLDLNVCSPAVGTCALRACTCCLAQVAGAHAFCSNHSRHHTASEGKLCAQSPACSLPAHRSSCNLQVGSQYTVRVSATDVAGVTGYAETDPVRIIAHSRSLAPGYVAAIVAGVTILSFAIAVAITMIVTRQRQACARLCCPPAEHCAL